RASGARREIARLYRRRLARVQFFTALAALLVTAAVSWMQNYDGIGKLGVIVPPLLPAVATRALALFGSLSYLLIHAVARLLVKEISEIPMERIEITWMRMLTSCFGRFGSCHFPDLGNHSIARIAQLLEQLNESIDRNSRLLHDSVLQLSTAKE